MREECGERSYRDERRKYKRKDEMRGRRRLEKGNVRGRGR